MSEFLSNETTGEFAMKQVIVNSTILLTTVLLAYPASACDLTKYVFQDQAGNEAVVQSVFECFSYYNKSRESRSLKGCRTLNAVDKAIKRVGKKDDLRLVGARIFMVRYKDTIYTFDKNAVVGVPWYFQSVNGEFEGRSDFKLMGSGWGEKMIADDDTFNFDDDETSRGMAGPLAGTKFTFKRCQ